jgi:outer membrane protein
VSPAPRFSFAAATLALIAFAPAHADSTVPPSPPIWEAGPGVALLNFPDYRGADHYNAQVLPLPYFVYRGERVRVGREGVKAQLLDSGRLEVSLSAAFALPGKTDSPDSPRNGMPELDPTFELGPSFDWWLTDNDPAHWHARIRVPIRNVIATNFQRIDQAGWLSSPNLHIDRRIYRGPWTFLFSGGVGTLWANHKYHAYFYAVPEEFATATRPAYDPGGGYSGARVSAFFGVRRGRWGAGLALLDDYLGGTEFADSPLMQTKNAAVIGLGFTYRLFASERTVGEEAVVD